MPSARLKFKLAKVLIAAAWADGRLANEELNSLKDFLFGIPDIGPDDWKKLMVYMESPVAENEARQLVDDLLLDVRGRKDRELVLETLGNLAAADGDVSAEEEEFIASVEEALDSTARGIFRKLGRSVGRVLRRRADSGGATEREEQLGDYINNEVYHYLAHALKRADSIRLPDADVRRMCLAAALTAWMLHSDMVIDGEDRAVLERSLIDDWGVTNEEAATVAEAACEKVTRGVDFTRLCRTYYEAATPEEAMALVQSLGRIARHAARGVDKKTAAVDSVRKGLKLGGR